MKMTPQPVIDKGPVASNRMKPPLRHECEMRPAVGIALPAEVGCLTCRNHHHLHMSGRLLACRIFSQEYDEMEMIICRGTRRSSKSESGSTAFEAASRRAARKIKKFRLSASFIEKQQEN